MEAIKEEKDEVSRVSHQVALAQKVEVPSVKKSFGFVQNLSSSWQMTKIDLRYILSGGPFIVITILGLLFVLLMFIVSGILFETRTLPTTKEMLVRAGQMFYIFILLLTLVYTGLIINRRSNDDIYQLEDVTSTKDWSFILSKFVSISLMQAVLLLVPIIAGVAYQIYNGYYQFEFGVYFRDFYGLRWLQMIPWTLLAIFIYTLIPNYYVGLVFALIFSIGFGFVDEIGIEQDIFRYNHGRGVSYSDIAGYGWYLKAFYFYRIYWILGGLFFVIMSWFVWRRGMPISIVQRLKMIGKRSGLKSLSVLFLSLLAFLSSGYYIYYYTDVKEEYVSSKEEERRQAGYEKSYKKYQDLAQPRTVDINLDVELFPSTSNLDARGYYWLKNKSSKYIDTLIIDYVYIEPKVSFERNAQLVFEDSIVGLMAFALEDVIAPGDSLKMFFEVKNKKNTMFDRNSQVVSNGTFFNNFEVFPSIGYRESKELSENKARRKYDLPDKDRMAPQSDTAARQNNYITSGADWLNFEIKIGTEKDQIAMAPGNLLREWEENDRKYYHYKMKRPMLNFYNICSARYEVKKDKWNDVDIAIYYHKGHDFNIDRMIAGLKDGFDYFTENFSPYQHDQVRILEVPRVGFAQSFANTIPFSENIGFVAMPDDSEEGGVDFTYSITAHELAHQWWAHQVIGANVQGATMLSESLSEYSSLKVLEKKYGKNKMRKFLKDALDKYLFQRSTERKKELPLAFNENQQYIHYNKG